MKKIIAILLAAVLLICTASVGFMSLAAEDATVFDNDSIDHPDGYFDLTDVIVHGTSTFWRVFSQLWVEIYFFFVDLFNGFPVSA